MNKIYAEQTVSISELKKSPAKVIAESENKYTAILNHNTPVAYIVPASLFEKMLEKIDDNIFSKSVQKRLNEKNKIVEVDIEKI